MSVMVNGESQQKILFFDVGIAFARRLLSIGVHLLYCRRRVRLRG